MYKKEETKRNLIVLEERERERKNRSYGEKQKQTEQFALELGERRNGQEGRRATCPECIWVTGRPSAEEPSNSDRPRRVPIIRGGSGLCGAQLQLLWLGSS